MKLTRYMDMYGNIDFAIQWVLVSVDKLYIELRKKLWICKTQERRSKKMFGKMPVIIGGW